MRMTYLPASSSQWTDISLTNQQQQQQAQTLRRIINQPELSWYYQDEVESITTLKTISDEPNEISSKMIRPLLEEQRISLRPSDVEIGRFSENNNNNRSSSVSNRIS